MQRWTVTFLGRVQGVGFRQTAVDIAETFAVSGTVQNLPNGDVELSAEGDGEEVRRFIAAVEKRMARYIVKSTRRREEAQQKQSGFSIQR